MPATDIHFHSADDRFCGTTAAPRRCTFDPNEVTCPQCMDRDCFEISPSGLALLAQLDARLSEQRA